MVNRMMGLCKWKASLPFISLNHPCLNFSEKCRSLRRIRGTEEALCLDVLLLHPTLRYAVGPSAINESCLWQSWTGFALLNPISDHKCLFQVRSNPQ